MNRYKSTMQYQLVSNFVDLVSCRFVSMTTLGSDLQILRKTIEYLLSRRSNERLGNGPQ
jgi:hypothetical protein